jgi:tetratricopeptide (TPR) repeat protein
MDDSDSPSIGSDSPSIGSDSRTSGRSFILLLLLVFSAFLIATVPLPLAADEKGMIGKETGSAPNAVSDKVAKPTAEEFQTAAARGRAAKEQGLYRDAEALLKNAVDMGRAAELPKKALLIPLNDLAGAYRHLGKLDQAETAYQEVLQILTDLDGANAVGYATVLDNLAQVYAMQGKLAQCEKMQKESIVIYGKSPDPRAKREKAIVIANLAQTYIDQKKYVEAESAFKDALALLDEMDPDSPQVAILYDNYSQLYRKQGKPEEAVAMQEKALKLLEKGLGKNHPEVAIALNNIAGTYYDLDRKPEAEQSLKRALEINEKVFGAESRQATNSLSSLVNFLRKCGKENDAARYEARQLADPRSKPILPPPNKP